MASDSRFYQLSLRHRPALWGDIGSLLKIEGVVIGGEGAQAILMLPSAGPENEVTNFHSRELTVEEWSEWLQRSDNPEILVQGSMEKIFHRKLRYDISGSIQQRVWAADNFKCMFCGAKMGATMLTIDHWVPLELGGANDTSNYLSCCRRENKQKGAMDPREWCKFKELDYDWFVEYLKNRQIN